MVMMLHNPELSLYRVRLEKRQGSGVHFLLDRDTSVVRKITIRQDVDNINTKITVETLSTDNPDLIEEGDIINILGPKMGHNNSVRESVHLYKTIVFTTNNSKGATTLECNDLGYYVSTHNRNLKINANETATEFIRRTAGESNIPVDKLASTQFKIPARFLESTTLYSAWIQCLTESMVEEDKLYHMYFSTDGLVLRDITEPPRATFLFEDRSSYNNLLSAQRERSIDRRDFVNVAIGNTGNVSHQDAENSQRSPNPLTLLLGLTGNNQSVTVRNESSISDYGEFIQDYDISGKTPEQGKSFLRDITDKAVPSETIDFTTYAVNNIIPGDRINVYSGLEGITGDYFVRNITTTIEPGRFTSRIKAGRLQDIPMERFREFDEGSNYIIGGVDFRGIIGEAPE